MPYCSVKWCGKCSTTSSLTKDGITFHRFPKCPKIKQKWINATKRDGNWFPGKNHVICSRHFTQDCFRVIRENRRFLFETAVPTLMLPCLESHQNLAEASTSSKPVTSNQKIIVLATQPTSSVNATYISLNGSVQNIPAMPSTYAESETVNRDTLTPVAQQNTNVDSFLSIPSNYSTPSERRLYRAVIDLTQKVKKKNVALKRLRDANRMLKRKVQSLRKLLGELEKNN
ncbi:unnamed protein product, partial [Brenthis ino]